MNQREAHVMKLRILGVHGVILVNVRHLVERAFKLGTELVMEAIALVRYNVGNNHLSFT